MLKLLSPLLLGSASTVIAASLANPFPGPSHSMNLTDLYASITNTTSLGDNVPGGVDPRFGVDYVYGSIHLRPIACLMNAVNAMADLALQDFNGNVRPGIARLPSYPDVVIVSDTITGSAGSTPVRYILWGIWSLALYMMKYDEYRTMFLTLGFDGVSVAHLRIERPDPQVLSLPGGNSDSSAERLKTRSEQILPAIPLANLTEISNSTNLSLTTNSTAPSNAGDLLVMITAIGHHLSINEFFTPIFAGLEYVARHPAADPVKAFRVRPADTDTWIEFREYGAQPRTEAPFFEYQWIATAMVPLLGQQMLLGWFEVAFVMQVDGVRVGNGWIRKG